jgi:formylglycine-generating enzyme required for sulfatase activity
MVLSGVRELNPVMSIWPFCSLQAAFGMLWEWCAFRSKEKYQGRLLCGHAALKVEFGHKTQAFLTVF